LAEVSSCVLPESSKRMGRQSLVAGTMRHVHLPLAIGMLQAMRGSAYPTHMLPFDVPGHPWQFMQCFVDIGQSTWSIVEVSTNLQLASVLCPTSKTQQEKAACSAALGNAMAALLYVISYLMQGLTDCINSTNVSTTDVACAADVSGFMNGIATIWSSASALASGDCAYLSSGPDASANQSAAELAAKSFNSIRRLLSLAHNEVPVSELPEYNQYKFLKNTVKDYDQTIRDLHRKLDDFKAAKLNDNEKAMCFVAGGQAPMYLVRAMVALKDGVNNCPQSQTTTQAGKIMCTVSLANMLGATYYTALYTSMLVTSCPAPDDQRAICGADIISVLTVFTSLIGSGADFPLSCMKLAHAPGPIGYALPPRRLAGNISGEPTIFV